MCYCVIITYLLFDIVGRPKKKRLSTPLPPVVSPDATPVAPPTIATPTPAPPSPPAVATKTDANMNHATPPSPPSNKDMDIATMAKEDPPLNIPMDNNTHSVTISNDITKEETSDCNDTAAIVEPVVTAEPVAVESIKKEIEVEKDLPSVTPSPPQPIEPVVPVQSPKQ